MLGTIDIYIHARRVFLIIARNPYFANLDVAFFKNGFIVSR